MNRTCIHSVAWALLAIPVLLAGTLVQAANVGVRDQAGFFSESATTAATRVISEIKTNLKRDLVIETYREIPAESRKGIDFQDKAAVKRAFETWSIQRARELGVQGVYVVITREPAHLQVAVGNETQRQAFTLADRGALVDRMLERFRSKQYDDALIAGVGFVRETLLANQAPGSRSTGQSRNPATPPPAPSRTSETEAPRSGFSIFSTLVPILLLGLAVIVVIRILSGGLFRRGSNAGMQPGVGGGGGGGGFMQSMLGGLFGAAAGMWLYNQFSGHGSSAFGAETPPDTNSNNDASGGKDTDYSSSGGDSGDSSGGGDSGGGGGDF